MNSRGISRIDKNLRGKLGRTKRIFLFRNSKQRILSEKERGYLCHMFLRARKEENREMSAGISE